MVKKTKYSKEDNIYLEVKQSIQEIKKIWTTIRKFDRTISRLAILQYQFEKLFGGNATTTGAVITTIPRELYKDIDISGMIPELIKKGFKGTTWTPENLEIFKRELIKDYYKNA